MMSPQDCPHPLTKLFLPTKSNHPHDHGSHSRMIPREEEAYQLAQGLRLNDQGWVPEAPVSGPSAAPPTAAGPAPPPVGAAASWSPEQSEHQELVKRLKGRRISIPDLRPYLACWPHGCSPHLEQLRGEIDSCIDRHVWR